MYELEVINGIIGQLSGIQGATIIPAQDYDDPRSDLMIVVGVETTLQMHPFLDDYKLDVSILIDSHITEDRDSRAYFTAKNAVDQAVRKIENLFPDFTSVFGETPVVGFYTDQADTHTLNESSNVCTKHVNVILSY